MTTWERVLITTVELVAGMVVFAIWSVLARSYGLGDAYAAGAGVIAAAVVIRGFPS